MPLPANQITNVEIQMRGVAAAGGSGTKNILFTFQYRRTAVVLPVIKGDVDTAFQAAVAVPICALLNNRYLQSMNTIRWRNDVLDQQLEFPHAVAGAIAGDGMAVAASSYILMRTGIKGKSYRGNKHFGPMSETDTTAGTEDTWNAACLARLATVAAALLAGFTDAGGNVWVPQIVSKKLSLEIFNPAQLIAYDVISCLTNKRVGWMKNRRVKSVY